MKEIKKWKDILSLHSWTGNIHGLEDLILLSCHYYPKWPMC